MPVEQSTLAETRSASQPLPSPQAAASEIVVEKIVFELNKLCRQKTLEFSLSVGALIIERLYRGELALWRRRGRKCNSLRRLAEHPGLPMSAPSLYRCIAIYEMNERLGVRSWRHVSTGHLRLVLSLPHADQERLLRNVEADKWSVSRLRQALVAMERDGRAAPPRGGRKRLSVVCRTSRQLDRGLDACRDLLALSPENVGQESRRSVLDLVQRMSELCAQVQHHFNASLVAVEHGTSGAARPRLTAPEHGHVVSQ